MGAAPSEAESALRRAFAEAIESGAETAGAIVQATRQTGAPMHERRHALMAALSEGNGLVRVPLSMITAATPVFPLDRRAGRSSLVDFCRILGPGSSRKLDDGTTEREWTLAAADGRREAGRTPYALRDATNAMRPAYCTIPFGALEAGETLRLSAVFCTGGVTSALLFVE